MAWAGLGVGIGALGLGLSGYNTYASRRDAQKMLDNQGDIFGSIPEAVPYEMVSYTPVDYGQVQMDTIHQQNTAFPDINALTNRINAALRQGAATRINGWSPGFTKNLARMGNTAGSLLQGRLPYEDVLGIVNDRQSLSNTLGTPGGSTNATLKDLGLSRMDAIDQGSTMMGRIASLSETIDPIARHSRPQDWMYTPSQSIPWKIQEQQFATQLEAEQAMYAHQTEQNAAVLAAMGDPSAMNQFGAQYLMSMQGGSGAALGQGLSQLGGLAMQYGMWNQNRQNQMPQGYGYNQSFRPDAQQQWYDRQFGNVDAYNNTYKPTAVTNATPGQTYTLGSSGYYQYQ